MPNEMPAFEAEPPATLDFATASGVAGEKVILRAREWGDMRSGPLSGAERAAFFAALRRKADARLAQFR
ncbi:hypothetical protein [Elioraea rosea]|uniref:hypothetical protein n=1 Tax=Elioraea rosea TaxID=2492390 RepID=UPI00118448D4|nr:hypothetical protein [Elioraea rosea]